jgi:hypothetical protein
MSASEWDFLLGMARFVLTFAGIVAMIYVMVWCAWSSLFHEEAVRR